MKSFKQYITEANRSLVIPEPDELEKLVNKTSKIKVSVVDVESSYSDDGSFNVIVKTYPEAVAIAKSYNIDNPDKEIKKVSGKYIVYISSRYI